MGCDAYASEEGVLEIEIRHYGDSEKIIGHIKIEGLEPGEKLLVEYLEGERR